MTLSSLHFISPTQGNYELRIDFRLGTRNVYAQYSSFKIGPESDK